MQAPRQQRFTLALAASLLLRAVLTRMCNRIWQPKFALDAASTTFRSKISVCASSLFGMLQPMDTSSGCPQPSCC